MASFDNGVVQFTDKSGKTVTTGVGNVAFVSPNLAFVGSKGRFTLKDDEFAEVHQSLGVPVPEVDDSDDDADFVTP